MKLRYKLVLALVSALVLTTCAGMFGLHKMSESNRTYARVVEVDYANVQTVDRMLVGFKTQVQEWKDTLLRGKDPQLLEKHWGGFEKEERAVDEEAKRLLESLPQGDVRALVARFAEAHAQMGEGYRKGLQAFKVANFDHAAGDAAVKGIDRAPSELLKQASEQIVAASAAGVAAATGASATAKTVSLSLMLAVLVFGIAGSMLVARQVTRPLNEAIEVCEKIAAGDLSGRIDVRTTDETGRLLQSMRTMAERLTSMVWRIRQLSESIGVATRQIAAGNQDLSSRTEEQASSLEETASSMEELTSTVRQNADNARQANSLAASASEIVDQGRQKVDEVVTTMHDIADSSRRIEDIIQVIDGIAFQTNILALNAAVEAARAGEQGRGFAVVAGEVRNLAQRSASAAKEIKDLIGSSVAKVDAGSNLVVDAGKQMHESVGAVKRVTDIVSEIAAASGEQAAGIEQVNQAVAQMDQVTQQNAALVEEAAAAAASLQEQARSMVEAVSVFKLADAEVSAAIGAHPSVRVPTSAKVGPRKQPVAADRSFAKAA
jgi:methyl-accepting chemotaxis protein